MPAPPGSAGGITVEDMQRAMQVRLCTIYTQEYERYLSLYQLLAYIFFATLIIAGKQSRTTERWCIDYYIIRKPLYNYRMILSLTYALSYFGAASNLADIITAEGVLSTGVLEDPALRAQLIALLPDGQQSEEFLEVNLRSSQFRQSLSSLSSALNSDNYNSVVANIGGGLDPNNGMQHLIQG